MQDLSLHILDLAQNSINAMADLIQIIIEEDTGRDRLTVTIKDNGRGMDPVTVKRITDPFYTTRTTRRVGMGVPLFAAAAEACGGRLLIESQPGKGTSIQADFILSHIDLPPMGSMSDTMVSLIVCNPSVDFVYSHSIDKRTFAIDTREIGKIIKGIPIGHPEVVQWIKAYIEEGLNEIDGGV